MFTKTNIFQPMADIFNYPVTDRFTLVGWLLLIKLMRRERDTERERERERVEKRRERVEKREREREREREINKLYYYLTTLSSNSSFGLAVPSGATLYHQKLNMKVIMW